MQILGIKKQRIYYHKGVLDSRLGFCDFNCEPIMGGFYNYVHSLNIHFDTRNKAIDHTISQLENKSFLNARTIFDNYLKLQGVPVILTTKKLDIKHRDKNLHKKMREYNKEHKEKLRMLGGSDRCVKPQSDRSLKKILGD
jgi:hypothetical protein